MSVHRLLMPEVIINIIDLNEVSFFVFVFGFFLAVLGFELKTSCLLGKHPTT
jgi:hypothetical protein